MIQKFIQNYYLRLVFNIILACSVLYLLSYIVNSQQLWLSSNRAKASDRVIHLDMEDLVIEEMSTKNEVMTTRQIIKDSKDPLVKNRFERIYKNRLWSDAGDGSGAGSTISYTDSVRAILRQVIDDYSIESMLDAPCGSFLWMPLMLRNVTGDFKSRGKRFRYHGVDVVESLITNAKQKYSNESDWEFSVCDFSAEDLPNGYDLVFSRDALQHLSYEKVFYSLRAYSRVQGAKYLLVGSYFGNYGNNKNIEVGNTFLINLAKPPFNLNQYVRIYHENKTEYEPKSLILYDIPNYLSKVNFDLMKDNLGIKFSL